MVAAKRVPAHPLQCKRGCLPTCCPLCARDCVCLIVMAYWRMSVDVGERRCLCGRGPPAPIQMHPSPLPLPSRACKLTRHRCRSGAAPWGCAGPARSAPCGPAHRVSSSGRRAGGRLQYRHQHQSTVPLGSLTQAGSSHLAWCWAPAAEAGWRPRPSGGPPLPTAGWSTAPRCASPEAFWHQCAASLRGALAQQEGNRERGAPPLASPC